MSIESALGDRTYGVKLEADGKGLVGALTDTSKAAETAEKKLDDVGKSTQTAAQQSKTLSEALKQQTGALTDTSQLLDKYEDLTGRRIPTALRGLITAAGPAALVVTALGAAAWSAYAQHQAFERQLTRTEVALIAQGRGAELSRERMADLTREVARLPGVSVDMAGQVVEAMSRVRSVGGTQMAELAMLTADFAAASGEDAPAAMRKLAAAVGDPARGVKMLQQEYGLLNADQQMAIERMVAYGQSAEAQGVLIDALRARLEGLADRGLSPVARLWERIKAAAAPAVTAIGDLPELAYYQPPAPRAFGADARGADDAAAGRYRQSAYDLSRQYAPELARRQQLEGARSQLQDAINYGGLNPEQMEAARAALANIGAELEKETDALQRYLTVAKKMDAAAQESISTGERKTQAQIALAEVERLYDDGQVIGTEKTMNAIRATLQHADALERLAIDRQRDTQISREAAQSYEQLAAQEAQAAQVVFQYGVATQRSVDQLSQETELLRADTERQKQLATVTADRYQRIVLETQAAAQANAERQKAIAFKQIDLDLEREMLALGPESSAENNDRIDDLYREAAARKAALGAAIDQQAAAQGARDAAGAVRREWESEQRALASTVQGTLTHALVTAFLDGGRSGGEALKAALKTTMATLVLEPLIRPIMMPIANIASQLSMSLFGSLAGGAGGAVGGLGGAAGGLGSSVGFAGLGAWLGKLGGGGSALQLGGPGAGAVTYTNAGGATAASSGALATTGFGALALGDLLSAQNGRDWTRTLYGGAPPLAGRINDKLGIPEFFTDPLGSVFGHGGDTRKQYTLFVTRAADGSYQLEEGGNPPAGVPSDRVLQNLGSNVDMSMLNSLQLWEQGSHGEDENAVIARLMARISPAILPDMATLVSSRAGLSGRLRQTLGVDSLQSFRDALNVSDLSGKGPTEQLGAARDIYERELSAVRGGDYSRIGNFESAAQQYLQLGHGMYATGQGYQDIWSNVSSALDEIGAKQKDVLGDLATQVLQSNKDNVDEIRSQTKQLLEALKQVQDQIRRSSASA